VKGLETAVVSINPVSRSTPLRLKFNIKSGNHLILMVFTLRVELKLLDRKIYLKFL